MLPDRQGQNLVMTALQGYLAHNNPPPLKTPQWPYAEGPVVILGGWVFLRSEVPLLGRKGGRGTSVGSNLTPSPLEG